MSSTNVGIPRTFFNKKRPEISRLFILEVERRMAIREWSHSVLHYWRAKARIPACESSVLHFRTFQWERFEIPHSILFMKNLVEACCYG